MISNEDRRSIGQIARDANLPEAHLLAVVDVESNGQVFADVNGKKLPVILFEPHIFFRRLKGANLERAKREGLAVERWNKKLYGKTQWDRWQQVERAAAIDKVAAYESASYGVGQVLGMHWKSLGYKDVFELVQDATSGLPGQVRLMLKYIFFNKLDDELRAGQWAPFARGYNGAGYAKNKYDTKLAAPAAMYGGADEKPEGILRMGSTGRRVQELQQLLVRAGYTVKPDRDFGPSTRDALKAFQRSNNLKDDGIYGPESERILGGFRQSADDKPGKQPLLSIPAAKKGIGSLIGAGVAASQVQNAKSMVESTASQIVNTGVQNVIVDHLVSGLYTAAGILGVVGLIAVAVGYFHEKKTDLA